MFDDAEVLHAYTRADAIRDGVLIDVSAAARDAGFTYPVALTAAAWSRCVEVPPGVVCQDEADRLWDVLTMLRVAASGPSDDLLLAVAQGCATGARAAGIRLPWTQRRDMMPLWSTRTWSGRTREGRLSQNERHPDERLASLRLVDSVMSLSTSVATITVFSASR